MTPLDAARKWVYTLLTGNRNLLNLLHSPASGYNNSVYSTLAPDNAIRPFIVMQHVRGEPDTMTQGGKVFALAELTFMLKSETIDNAEQVGFDIFTQIDTSLQGASNSSWNGYWMNAIRMQEFNLPVVNNGKQYRQIGAYYQILVRPPIG